MYIVTVFSKDGKVAILQLKTEKRPLARGTALLLTENGVKCTVTAEVQPREVKFK